MRWETHRRLVSLTIILVTVLVGMASGASHGQYAGDIVVVRHAEKLESWKHSDRLRPLTVEGFACAEALATFLKEKYTTVDAVFTSPYLRTVATGLAVLDAFETSLHTDAVLASESLQGFGEKLPVSSGEKGSVTVVVGHSNNVALIVRELGAPDATALSSVGLDQRSLPDDRYGDVWIVQPQESARRLVHERLPECIEGQRRR
jgi:phosphohistidine phosphatase SixA